MRKSTCRRREERMREAVERQTAWAKLTPEQQLAAIDRRLGVGVGAVKQRLRLRLALCPSLNPS